MLKIKAHTIPKTYPGIENEKAYNIKSNFIAF